MADPALAFSLAGAFSTRPNKRGKRRQFKRFGSRIRSMQPPRILLVGRSGSHNLQTRGQYFDTSLATEHDTSAAGGHSPLFLRASLVIEEHMANCEVRWRRQGVLVNLRLNDRWAHRCPCMQECMEVPAGRELLHLRILDASRAVAIRTRDVRPLLPARVTEVVIADDPASVAPMARNHLSRLMHEGLQDAGWAKREIPDRRRALGDRDVAIVLKRWRQIA